MNDRGLMRDSGTTSGYWYPGHFPEPVDVLNLLRRYREAERRMRLRTRGSMGMGETDLIAVRLLLRRHQANHQSRAPREEAAVPARSTHEELRRLRKELNGLVGAWHHRTDLPHGVIHAQLRSACGGPPSAIASADELQQRVDRIREWAVTGRRD